MGYYPQNKKEFDDHLINQIIEIENMNLSEEDKKNMYSLVRETIRNYHELTDLNLPEHLSKWTQSLDDLLKQQNLIGEKFKKLSKGVEYLHKIDKVSKDNLIKGNLGKN